MVVYKEERRAIMVLTVWRVKGNKNQKPAAAAVPTSYKENNTEITVPDENKTSVFKSFIDWLLE